MALTAFIPSSVTSDEGYYKRDWAAVAKPSRTAGQAKVLRDEFLRVNKLRLQQAADRALTDSKPDIIPGGEIVAECAIRQAVEVVSQIDFTQLPWIGISDEGIVTLQWQCDDNGVVLFFSGDGVFSLSTKSGPNEHYSTGYREHSVADKLPTTILSEISRLSETGDKTIAA